MAEKRLRAVKPGESLPVPSSISEALAGTSRDVLAAMRRQLAQKLDDGEVSSNSLASSMTKLQELDRLIRAADAEREAEEAKANAEPTGRARRSFHTSAV